MTANKSALKWAVLLLSCLLISPLQTLGQSTKRKTPPEPTPRATVTLAIASSLLTRDLRDLQD